MDKVSEKDLEKILLKLKPVDVCLSRAEVVMVDTDFDLEEPQFKKQWNYSIQEHTSETVEIKTDFMAYFVPEAFFNIRMEYLVSFKVEEEVNRSEIDESIEFLLGSCAATNSLLIGLLTDKMGYAPIVLPPLLELNKD